jgi:hypothetical protein
MFGLFNSLVDLASDVVTVVTAPVKVAVDVTGAVVKPVAQVAEEVVREISSLKD